MNYFREKGIIYDLIKNILRAIMCLIDFLI